MARRRTLLRSTAVVSAATVAGCSTIFGQDTVECPQFPSTDGPRCESAADSSVELAVEPETVERTPPTVTLAVRSGPVSIRPSAHAIFDRHEDAWRAQRIVEANDEAPVELADGDRYRWQLRFEGETGTQRVDDGTTEIATHLYDTDTYGFCVPVLVDGRWISLGTVYEIVEPPRGE